MAMAMATSTAITTQTPQVSAEVVGNAFVQQYYHILHHSPELVYRFYQDISKLGRPDAYGQMTITTTMQAINDKIMSLNYRDLRAEIKSVDAQDSYQGGVQVLVTGYLTGTDNKIRNFAQDFFLAPQDKGYFVLNDIFRYVGDGDQQNADQGLVANDVVDTATPVPNPPPPVKENNLSDELSTHSTEEVNGEEVNGGEVYNPPENGDAQEEEVPVAEVVDEVRDESHAVVESNTKIEEVPKKSYASIVMDLKESAVSFSPPAPAPRKPVPKIQEQVNPPAEPEYDGHVPHSFSVDDASNQDGEADGYSIYIKGLPLSASASLLENEFKKFGPIKDGGIQVRNNRLQGFCFGFVEFEVSSAVQKAIEASPIAIGGRQAVVEEKRSTNTRGNNRGRFASGRGSGFRNEGVRGRGNYGGGRNYSRGDYNGRSEFSNRGGGRGGSSNRGGDGYQRSDSNGGRMNRMGAGGIANGPAKNMAPRVSATA